MPVALETRPGCSQRVPPAAGGCSPGVPAALGAPGWLWPLPSTPGTHPGCPHGPLALLPGLCEQPEERICPWLLSRGRQMGARAWWFPLGGPQLLGSPGQDLSPHHPPVPRSSGGGGEAAVRAAGGLLGDRRHHVHPVSAGWARGARGGQGGALSTRTPPRAASRGTPPSTRRRTRMTTRTTTRTSSAKSWPGTTSSTRPTGTISRRRVSPGAGGGGREGSRGSPGADTPLPPAKELVTRLMEVEQDQRITAEEAISHEW